MRAPILGLLVLFSVSGLSVCGLRGLIWWFCHSPKNLAFCRVKHELEDKNLQGGRSITWITRGLGEERLFLKRRAEDARTGMPRGGGCRTCCCPEGPKP